MRSLPLAVLLILCSAATCGCRRDDPRPEVVLYVSADHRLAREVIDAFERAHPVRVRLVTDTEATKTTGLVQRLRAERDNPQADVFWSSEVFMTIALAAEGVLVEHLSDATVEWPESMRDGQRRWYGFGARPRVVCYHRDRVAPEDLPQTWMDLTQPRWRGRIVMADPRFGTTGGHLGAMMAYWDGRLAMPGYYEAFLEGLAANDVRLLPSGNAGVVEAVALGEADLGMTDTDDVWAARARGLAVDLVYPRHHAIPEQRGGGTLLIPNTVARVAGGPNPEAAALLIDFLLSHGTERQLAESVSRNIPVNPALAESYGDLRPPDPLRIDLTIAAARRDRAVALAVEWLAED